MLDTEFKQSTPKDGKPIVFGKNVKKCPELVETGFGSKTIAVLREGVEDLNRVFVASAHTRIPNRAVISENARRVGTERETFGFVVCRQRSFFSNISFDSCNCHSRCAFGEGGLIVAENLRQLEACHVVVLPPIAREPKDATGIHDRRSIGVVAKLKGSKIDVLDHRSVVVH